MKTTFNLLIFFFFLSSTSSALDLTWTGATSHSWSDSSNFSPMVVPGSGDTVTIDTTANHPILSSNVSIYQLNMIGDTLDLNGYQMETTGAGFFIGGVIIGGHLKCSGTVSEFSGTQIMATIHAQCSGIRLNGSEFHETAFLEINGSESSAGTGGNTFFASVTLKNSGTTDFRLATTGGDTFKDSLTLINISTRDLQVSVSDTSYFQKVVTMENHSTGVIHFGRSGGVSILEQGGVLEVNSAQFSSGTLMLNQIVQENTLNQRLELDLSGLPSDHAMLLVTDCRFKGEVDFTSPSLLIRSNRFEGLTMLTKTGGSHDHSDGGNDFVGQAMLTNLSTSGNMRLGNSSSDYFREDVTLASGSHHVFAGYKKDAYFYKDVTIDSLTTVVLLATLAGTVDQELKGASPHQYNNLTLDKPTGKAIAQTPVEIINNMQFRSGHLQTDSTNLITFMAGAAAYDASNASFVSGPVKKVGNTAFEFPVGKRNDFRPIAMSAPDSLSDVFVAEYHRDSVLANTGSRDTTLGRIIRDRYWDLYRLKGVSDVHVTLSWNESNRLSGTLISVAAWSGSIWQNIGKGTLTGDSLNGTIQSAVPATNYFQFTIGYERNQQILTTNICHSITDAIQLQTCLNHANEGDILEIEADIVLPEVSGQAGSITFPLVIGSGVTLQSASAGASPHWWEPGCYLISSNFKMAYDPTLPHTSFLFAMESGAAFQNLRLRGAHCHYQDENQDGLLCGGIYKFSDGTATTSIKYSEISCFNYAGIFKGDGQGNLDIENCYIHKVKGKGTTAGIGYGVWTMGHETDLSVINFINNIFDDCKAAIDGQGDPIDWNINNCTFSQFFYSEDINKHNDNRFRIYHINSNGNQVFDYHYCYNNMSCSSNCFYGPFSVANPPCTSATSQSFTYTTGWQSCGSGISFPLYDIGGANTTIENCLFHKKWRSNQNGNISLNFPNRDVTNGGAADNGIYINNNTFATERLDPLEAISLNNNTGYARIADNYIDACVWGNDPYITKDDNSFNYKPGTTVTGSAPQPFEFSLQLMNDAGTDPLESSNTNSATSGHRFMQFIDINEDFKIDLANAINGTNLTYIIRSNPNAGSGISNEVISNENYFYQNEEITNSTSVTIAAIDKPGLYGIDVLAFDANDQDAGINEEYQFKGSEWKHIPLIVKDDAEEQVFYFNIKDSYLESNSQTSTGVMKQAYLNGQLLWEEDIADGGDGWEYVRVPLSSYLSALHTDGTPNVIFFRIHIGNTAVDANMVRGVKVWVDDVYLKKFDSPTGDNLIRDGSVELIIPDDLPTGAELDAPWFRNDLDNFSCSGQSRPGAVYISSTDRKSSSQAILLEMPDISNICQSYPNNVIVSAGTIIDFTELLSCTEYSSLGFTAFPCTTCTTLLNLSGKYFIDDDITISDDITLSGSQVKVANGKSITVSAGGHLTIQNDNNENSHLFPCDEMWQGIVVEPGGRLTIDGNTNNPLRGTLIEGALRAVDCDGCHLECRYAEFNHNLIALEIKNNPHSSSYIRGTAFRCRDGSIGKLPEADKFPMDHVRLENITNFSFPIGIATGGNGIQNKFYEALRGISVINSNVTITRGLFKDVNNKNGLYHVTIPSSAISVINDGAAQNCNVVVGGPGGPGLTEKNIFENVNIGVRVYNDCPTCSLSVVGNEFDNSSAVPNGAAASFHNTAVTLQSPLLIPGFASLIGNNKFKDFRTAIHGINIDGIAIQENGPFDSEFMFNQTSSFEPNEKYRGIWLQSCDNAYVKENEINNIEPVTSVTSSFRGIDVESSTNTRINCNEITNIPISMRFLGYCDGSLLRQNEMSGYREGIWLESATIGDQFQVNNSTFDEEPLDNIWNDSPQAANDPTDRVTGTNAGGQINWYYRTAGGIYDPLDNGTTSQNINTVPETAATIDCSDQSNRQSRNVRFGGTVVDSLQFDSYEDENTWLARSYAYASMKEDTTIMYQDTLTDIYFINFFNETDTTNIGAFEQVLNMSPDSASRINASTLNQSIIPVLDLEIGFQDALDVYLNVVANSDTLTGSDTLLLEQIANLDYYLGGKAIYMAAAMLGLEVSPSIPQLRMMPDTFSQLHPINSKFDNQFKIYPNPATDFFVLVGPDDEFKSVELYDMHSKRVMFWDDALSDTQISINITTGIYAIKVVTTKNEVFWGKLVVLGR